MTARDTIADTIRETYWDAQTHDWARVADVVITAVRSMPAEDQADVIGGTVETAPAPRMDFVQPGARAIGQWKVAARRTHGDAADVHSAAPGGAVTATLDTPTVITEGQSAAARHWRAQQVGRRPQEQAELVTGPVTTRTGKVLTEADFEELAAEAERGYDLPKDSP